MNLESNYIAYLTAWKDGHDEYVRLAIDFKKNHHYKDRSINVTELIWENYVLKKRNMICVPTDSNKLVLIETLSAVIFKDWNRYYPKFTTGGYFKDLKFPMPEMSKFNPVADDEAYRLGRIGYTGLIRAIYYHCGGPDFGWGHLHETIDNLDSVVRNELEKMA